MSPRKKPSAELVPVIETAELVAEPATPAPLLRARVAVYATEGGGVVVAMRTDAMAHDAHVLLRPAMLKLIARIVGAKGGLDLVEALRQLGSASQHEPEDPS